MSRVRVDTLRAYEHEKEGILESGNPAAVLA